MSAVERFREWLTRIADEKEHGYQLPYDRALAEQFGVSLRTVTRIMRHVAEQGRIERIRGKGTFVGKAPKPQAPPPLTAPERLQRDLIGALQRGELKEGEALPSVKYMCRQFHVSPSTVTAAYVALQRTGHVTRIGKNYWLGQPGVLLRSGKRREIAVFVEDHEQLASLYHPQTFASVAFRKLEDILSTSGYTVRYRYHPQLHERVKLWLERRDLPAGVVLYRCDGHQARRHQALRDLVRQRRPFPPLPVLLDLNWGLFERRSKNVSVFSRNHVYTTVGRTLGTYLRRMGCRTLSLVLPNELSSAYPSYPTHFQAATKLFIEIKHVIPEIEADTALVDDSPDADIAPDKLSRQCKLARFDKYGALLPEAFTGRIALRGSVREAVRTRGGADVMVFSHDSLAAEALEVCRTQRIAVPRQLAIIGLENDPAYFHLGISTCMPDWDGIGYLMAHALMQDFAIEKTGKGFIQTRAKMIYRTTAAA